MLSLRLQWVDTPLTMTTLHLLGCLLIFCICMPSQNTGAGDACIAVCVEKANSVWLLHHLVQPFTAGDEQASKVKCKS